MNYSVLIYQLVFRKKESNRDFVLANLDSFFVDIPEDKKTILIDGKYGWKSRSDAEKVLKAMQEKYTDLEFNMILVHYGRTVIKYLE